MKQEFNWAMDQVKLPPEARGRGTDFKGVGGPGSSSPPEAPEGPADRRPGRRRGAAHGGGGGVAEQSVSVFSGARRKSGVCSLPICQPGRHQRNVRGRLDSHCGRMHGGRPVGFPVDNSLRPGGDAASNSARGRRFLCQWTWGWTKFKFMIWSPVTTN